MRISTGNAPLPDSTKLLLLEGSLDARGKRELQLLQKKTKGALSYLEFYARLKARHGKDRNLGTRKIWQEVMFPTAGKVGHSQWIEFKIAFRAAQNDVEDSTEEEAQRLLISRLPV